MDRSASADHNNTIWSNMWTDYSNSGVNFLRLSRCDLFWLIIWFKWQNVCSVWLIKKHKITKQLLWYWSAPTKSTDTSRFYCHGGTTEQLHMLSQLIICDIITKWLGEDVSFLLNRPSSAHLSFLHKWAGLRRKEKTQVPVIMLH